jgi:hypothetical protein
VRVRHVANLKAPQLRGAIREHIARSARLVTDEYHLYTAVGREFEGGHHTVTHSAGEYARGDIHTNTIEGFFSILKRGLYGTYHAVSRAHLHRYLSEFEFRYNNRHVDDGERTVRAIRAPKQLAHLQRADRASGVADAVLHSVFLHSSCSRSSTAAPAPARHSCRRPAAPRALV